METAERLARPFLLVGFSAWGTPVDPLLVVLGTFAFCACSAMIPLLHAEAYLLATSLLVPPELRWPLVIAATSGQMLGKVGMYYAGRGVRLIPGERMQRRIRLATERYRDKRQLGSGLVFLSASSGFPPFYIVSIAAGTLTFPLMPRAERVAQSRQRRALTSFHSRSNSSSVARPISSPRSSASFSTFSNRAMNFRFDRSSA